MAVSAGCGFTAVGDESMKPPSLAVEALSAEAFEAFGDVIEAKPELGTSINYGVTTKFPDLVNLDVAAEGGRPAVHLYECEPLGLPLLIEVMERHPLGSQAFFPLHDRPFLVVVAAAGEAPDASGIRAFITNGQQGINLRRGVWHHYQITLDRRSRYLVVDRQGPGENFDEHRLSQALLIENVT